MNLLTKTFC